MTAPLTLYTVKLTDLQSELVLKYLTEHHFELVEVPYAKFAARRKDLNVVYYQSGKLVAQGKGTEEFVQFFLETEILQQARLGYDEVLHPKAFTPHIGVDESGKGDYFGPMVVAAVFVSKEGFSKLRALNVRDSKTISSDKKILDIARGIRDMPECAMEVIKIGPPTYNRLQSSMGNVNNVLGWGHARAIENTLVKIDPEKTGKICSWAISDQFGNKRIIEKALLERGKMIELEQRHKAEEDLAVAAASIVARAGFVYSLEKMEKQWGLSFPKGASAKVIEIGKKFIEKHGTTALEQVAKLHFQTTQKITS